MPDHILVTAAGGFIGGHLVKALLRMGYKKIRAVDIKPINQWYQFFPEVNNVQCNLRNYESCKKCVEDIDAVYNLAGDMGGMGFIENNKAQCMLNVLINTHLLMAAKEAGVKRFFFSSSACVYNTEKQNGNDFIFLSENDAYPALPEDGYGWEKLFSERMCRHFSEDFGITTRIARFHNIYGPYGAYQGGREKAPAAICRKIIEAKLNGSKEIEIWGDGTQLRSFTYIDDCIEGVLKIMSHPELDEPINLASNELVTINQLVDIIEAIAGIKLKRRYNIEAPQGVLNRNSDNTLIKERLNWEPSTSIYEGMKKTYSWILEEITKRSGLTNAA